MDINTLGIGAIFGAIVVASTNLYIFIAHRKKDEIKERIDKLYSPMYVYYMEHMKYGISNPNKGFIEFKKIYIRNSIYASDVLKELFESLLDVESEFKDLVEAERIEKMNRVMFKDDKGLDRDLKSMMYRICAWIEREHDELQIYYAMGLVRRFLWRLKVNHDESYARTTIPAGRSFN